MIAVVNKSILNNIFLKFNKAALSFLREKRLSSSSSNFDKY